MTSPRIIAGAVKGIHLKSIPGTITRPITDRVKEALFNIIGQDIVDSNFLDLFGGTGSVGLEALSRGANFARFIDINSKVIQILKENINKCGFTSTSDVIKIDALRYLSINQEMKFDYIFVAPPQYKKIWIKILYLLDEYNHHLKSDAWIIIQIDPLENIDLDLKNFYELDRRKYGNTLLKFFQFK